MLLRGPCNYKVINKETHIFSVLTAELNLQGNFPVSTRTLPFLLNQQES